MDGNLLILISDDEFREKFKKAAENYKGEQDEKAVFDNLLLPLAQESELAQAVGLAVCPGIG